jgi:DNA-directed RNA polymerase subunit RPC12/RpoP
MVTVVSTEPHPSVVKEAICRNCGATLNYVPVDIKEEVQSDYGGGREIVHFIKCPPCGHKVIVRGY